MNFLSECKKFLNQKNKKADLISFLKIAIVILLQ